MFYDVVKVTDGNERAKGIEVIGRRLGFFKVVFLDEFYRLNVVDGVNDAVIRKAVSNKKTDVLLNPHQRRKDRLHFRNSGLNHVLCRLANENKVAIGFSFDMVQNTGDIGRIMQNIQLCRKYNVKIMFFTFAKNVAELKGIVDLVSFLRCIGMTGSEAKRAFTYLGEIIKDKKENRC